MPRYTFNADFQKSILKLLMSDEAFLLKYRNALDPDWFTSPDHRAISAAILHVADVSSGLPSIGSVIEAIPDYVEMGVEPEDVVSELKMLDLGDLPSDIEFIRKKVVEFGAVARVNEVLLTAPSMMEAGKLAEFVDEIRDAAFVASPADVEPYDHLDTFMDRMTMQQGRDGAVIGTGLQSIDNHLDGGGLGGGEMCVLCGLPGKGKTETLVNIGANAIRAGKRVFHALIGDSPANRVALRYDSNFTGWSIPDIRLNIETAHSVIRDMYKATGGPGRLRIQWWPANTITPQNLEDYIRFLYVRYAWKPDVVIVDYGANMKPPKVNEKRHEQGDIYKALNALSGRLGVPLYTAIQASRKDGTNPKTLTMDHFAEAFEPARDATLILTVNLTTDDLKDNEIRYHCTKYRDGSGGWTETVSVDFSTHTLTDIAHTPIDLKGKTS